MGLRLVHRVDEHDLAGNLLKTQTTSDTMTVFRQFLSRWSAIWAHAAAGDRVMNVSVSP